MVDDQFIYSMQYNTMNWKNASEIYTERSYSLSRAGYGKFYHIFSHHNNQELPFINGKSRPGYIFNQKGLHDAIINIQDYAENTIEIRAYFISDTLPRFNYSTHFQNNECKIIFNQSVFFNKFDAKMTTIPFFLHQEKNISDCVLLTHHFENICRCDLCAPG